MSPKPGIAILGGGLAGISAALRLADQGFEISLFEKRFVLGGRASSVDVATGEASPEFIDNCQHVLLRSCTSLIELYRRIGASDCIAFHPKIQLLDRQGRISTIAAAPLPAPLHLLPSLLFFRALSFREKISLARALRKVGKTEPDQNLDFLTWLRQQKQSENTIESFWKPFLISALNEELDRISAAAAFPVIEEAFFKTRHGYELGLPTQSLAEIYSQRGGKALESAGVRVHLKKAVTGLDFEKETHATRLRSVLFSDGTRVEADFFLSTLHFPQLLELLPEQFLGDDGFFSGIAKLETSPITGIHLWFDRPLLKRPFLALSGRTIQWIFAKEGNYLSLVVSASRELMTLSKDEILKRSLADLYEAIPQAKTAKLLRSMVLREKQATYSPVPGSENLRPSQQTPISNLFLAGDWTLTDWPATMEGAVRSGEIAADAIAKQLLHYPAQTLLV